MKYRATCSKWSSKLVLSVTADSIDQAKYIVHSQGYSIIEIHEMEDDWQASWNFFFFDAYVNGVLQTGKIQSNDVFKSYRKLVEDLKYDVKYIYTAPGMNEDQKKKITARVKDGYNLYKESLNEKWEELQEKKTKEEEEENILNEFSPEILKELERYETVIEETLEKIQNLLIKYHDSIGVEQKNTLNQIELELTKIKWTRNISKIKHVLEDSLGTIGSVELFLLKQGMVKEKKQFLSKTNELLKEIWSDTKVQTQEEKESDIGYKLQSLFSKITDNKKEEKDDTNTASATIDTNSFVYLKNKRELSIYKKRLQKNLTDIVKNIFSFKFWNLKRLLLKRKLLRQNIQIIESRINQKHISYTKIVHGVDYYVNMFFEFISTLSFLFSLILVLYIFVYIILASADTLGYIHLEFIEKSLLYITIFTLLNYGFSYIKGWKTWLLVVFLLYLGVSFLVINF